ncbi:zinc finger protein [Saccharopolyspora griseoalba]|uniref:Zinc finger protein n=1 Tax=Saccharopolyspora griseoalba TaxID=1431848 RepID=A0ABW2LJ51_9PSEU
MLFPGLEPERPVVHWRPLGGLRHGVAATELPRTGQERRTLCGELLNIVDASELDWLAPTCESCWTAALAPRDGDQSE